MNEQQIEAILNMLVSNKNFDWFDDFGKLDQFMVGQITKEEILADIRAMIEEQLN
jgi:hypothetical protein